MLSPGNRGEPDTDLVLEDPAEDKYSWGEVTGNGGAILFLLSGSWMSRWRCSKLGGAQRTLRKVAKRIWAFAPEIPGEKVKKH